MASRASNTNVVRLPTAAPRKVQQRFNKHLRDYREANPWPGDHRWPGQKAEPAFSTLERTPELLILMVLFKELSGEQKAAIRKGVHDVHLASPSDETLDAFKLVNGLS